MVLVWGASMNEAVQTSASTAGIWTICVVGVAVLMFWLIAVVVADARQNRLSRRTRISALPGPFHGTGPLAEATPGAQAPGTGPSAAGAVPRARIPAEAERAAATSATSVNETGTAGGRHARPATGQGPQAPARPDLPGQRQAPGRHAKEAPEREPGQPAQASPIGPPSQPSAPGTESTPGTQGTPVMPRQRTGESDRAARSRSGGGASEGDESGQE